MPAIYINLMAMSRLGRAEKMGPTIFSPLGLTRKPIAPDSWRKSALN
jgi:hypothetical protein